MHTTGTLIVFVPADLCIAYAFRELEQGRSRGSGHSFTWNSPRVRHPDGLNAASSGLITADVVVIASLAQIAEKFFLEARRNSESARAVSVTVTGVAFMALAHQVLATTGIEISDQAPATCYWWSRSAISQSSQSSHWSRRAPGARSPQPAHALCRRRSARGQDAFGRLSNSFLLAIFIYSGSAPRALPE